MTPLSYALLRLLCLLWPPQPLEAPMPPRRRPPPWPRYVYAPDDGAAWHALIQALAVALRAGRLTPREYGVLLATLSRQWGGWRAN